VTNVKMGKLPDALAYCGHKSSRKYLARRPLAGHQQLSWHRSAWDGPQLKAKEKISVYHGLYRQMEV